MSEREREMYITPARRFGFWLPAPVIDVCLFRAHERQGTAVEVSASCRKPQPWYVTVRGARVYIVCVCVAAVPRSVLWLQGSISALNGLGWYHGTVLKEHAKALEYYQRAAFNGSSADAVFNLGVYRLNGKHPWRPERNEVRHGGKLIFMEALAKLKWLLDSTSKQWGPTQLVQ